MRQEYYKVVVHHFFLGLVALLMIKQTLVMSEVVNFNPFNYLIAFLSTLFVYQLAVSGLSFPFKASRIHRNKIWITGMLILSFLLVISIVKSLSIKEEIVLLCALIFCFGYFTSVQNWKGLRSIPLIKALLLSVVWSVVTVVFPLINQWNWNTDFYLFLQRFLFMLGICIVYNLRDVAIDRKHGVVTIASLAGEKNTRLISLACILLFVISIFATQTSVGYKEALILSAIITAVAISRARINGNTFYYRYLIDGCMLLQSLLVLLQSNYQLIRL